MGSGKNPGVSIATRKNILDEKETRLLLQDKTVAEIKKENQMWLKASEKNITNKEKLIDTIIKNQRELKSISKQGSNYNMTARGNKPLHETFENGRIKQNASDQEEIYFQKLRTKEISQTELDKFNIVLKTNFDRITKADSFLGGVVPIRSIRNDLYNAGYNIEQQDSLLLRLERNSIIDLQTASDATLLKEPNDSIWSKARGAISYINYRQ